MKTLQAEMIEKWSRIASDTFLPTRVHVDESFRCAIEQVRFADIGITRVAATPASVWRDAALIAADQRDDLLLTIHLTGTGWFEQAGRTARLTANTAVFSDTGRPYELRFDSAMSELVFQLPRKRIRLRDKDIRESAARLIESDAAGLTVLRHVLAGIMKDGRPTDNADQLAETTIELLSATLRRGHRATALSGETLLQAARVYMRRHLTDPGLDIEAVAGAHFVSRRYLELQFARIGESPAAYLRELRLGEAQRRLRETSATVTDIAYGVGFNDVNTFTRAFRRAHELTPREWRRHHLCPREDGRHESA
ncbi:AraC family transcriptional regulator [Nocardia panacis]|nr:AraC family transcriptional regulator [Nocardia panacis]